MEINSVHSGSNRELESMGVRETTVVSATVEYRAGFGLPLFMRPGIHRIVIFAEHVANTQSRNPLVFPEASFCRLGKMLTATARRISAAAGFPGVDCALVSLRGRENFADLKNHRDHLQRVTRGCHLTGMGIGLVTPV